MKESPSHRSQSSLFDTAGAVAVAPILTTLSALLGRVEPESMRMDADLFSRSLIAGARYFQPTVIWLNFKDLPELALLSEMDARFINPAALAEAQLILPPRHLAFAQVMRTYSETFAHVASVVTVPTIATVLGPDSFASLVAHSGDQPTDSLADSFLELVREAINRYAKAGVEAICVLDRYSFRSAEGSDKAAEKYMAAVHRIIRSHGLVSLLDAGKQKMPPLADRFDCVIYPPTDAHDRVFGRKGIGIRVGIDVTVQSPAAASIGVISSAVARLPVALLATDGEIPTSVGVERGRRIVEDLKLLALKFGAALDQAGERASVRGFRDRE